MYYGPHVKARGYTSEHLNFINPERRPIWAWVQLYLSQPRDTMDKAAFHFFFFSSAALKLSNTLTAKHSFEHPCSLGVPPPPPFPEKQVVQKTRIIFSQAGRRCRTTRRFSLEVTIPVWRI